MEINHIQTEADDGFFLERENKQMMIPGGQLVDASLNFFFRVLEGFYSIVTRLQFFFCGVTGLQSRGMISSIHGVLCSHTFMLHSE